VLVLGDSQEVAAYYDATLQAGADAKMAANWVMGDIMAHVKAEKVGLAQLPLRPTELAELVALIKEGAISGKASLADDLSPLTHLH